MVAIHCDPVIPWHKRVRYFSEGLKALGIKHEITTSRTRVSDVAVLFGTTLWQAIEQDGEWLLVDRASIGDPEYVQLVWNGHGRRGDHKVPDACPSRLEARGVKVDSWRASPGQKGKRVLCGQQRPYSPNWRCMADWYAHILKTRPLVTHFRPHPAGTDNVRLPTWGYWQGVDSVVTLNSSVAVEAIIKGIPTEVHDEGGMAYPGFKRGEDRMPWLHWLAWTDYSWLEISQGLPIAHLFE